MSPQSLLRQPFWLPRQRDDTYYVDTGAITDKAWDTIFNNLSKYPDLNFGLFDIGDPDTRAHIRQRLAYLLPVSNYQYSHGQTTVWNTLMDSPMAVSNQDLQKVVPMKDYKHPLTLDDNTVPNSRGFFVYSWTISVLEFDTLVDYLLTEESTFSELIEWNSSMSRNRLNDDDRFTIRYVGSCAMSEWPAGPMENIYSQTDDVRSGNLADFLKALLCALPTVAATHQCHLIQYITSLAEDKEGLHELMHFVLIEFFGASFVLNSHPNNKVSELFTERISMVADLNLRFDRAVLERKLECPPVMINRLQNHFKRIKDYLHHVPHIWDAAGINSGMFQLDEAKCAALLDQSMPQYYKGNRPIMTITAQSMHINDYIHGRPFSFSRDPDNQLVGQLLSHFGDLDPRAMQAVVTLGEEMAKLVANKTGSLGRYDHGRYLDAIGQPIRRRIGEHHFIHVPLMDPSWCRYGLESVDEMTRNFMQTSFANAMLIADKVMQVLDIYEAPDSSAEDSDSVHSEQYYGSDSEAICHFAMWLYAGSAFTHTGRAFRREVEEDARVLREEAEDLPLFIV
ncbi:hypothetical protein GGR58DRAFT_527290 [Xylaria digitata]|nr:hypothetical protein GGR58DRAFT_527290 [Xylaria digitata]